MKAVEACLVCDSDRTAYVFTARGNRVARCQDCGLMFLSPQPGDAELAKIYTEGYFLGSDDDEASAAVSRMKRATAAIYVHGLAAYHGAGGGRLLEIGCGRGEFLEVAQAQGFEVHGLDVNASAVAAANQALGREAVRVGDLDSEPAQAAYDVACLFDVLEHARRPMDLLRRVHGLLKPGGTLFIVTPSLDSFSARLLKQDWMEFKTEHLAYFDRRTAENAVAKAGFRDVEISQNVKVLTPDYIHHHFQRFQVPLFTRALALGRGLMPAPLRGARLKLPSSGLNLLCKAGELRERPLLSIIVPVYNEASTFPELASALMAKELDGLDKEIVFVESNSSDGTRDQVQALQGLPGVKVVLEERPQGKGHAVRTGLALATGDIVMIQDGDLEYDINDYDQLLEPLRTYRNAVVLGSRHSGSWKIREFTDQPLVSMVLNAAHYFFASLINVACGASLRDPFTMYKLFRRDCLHGMTLKADRFDFDWELIIKLLRRGYLPLELPVNYHSRSFKQGKKVRLIRDPLNWLWALVRFRLGPL